MSTVESCNITSPFGTETKCAKLVITDVTQEFALEDIMQKGETYTFSAWVKSDGAGSITIGKDTFLTSKEWGRIRTTFDATSEDFSLGFDALGAYYLLQSQLETGNKGTDWTPNPDDIDRRFSNIELQITKEGIKTIIGDTYQTKDGMKDYVTLVSYESYIEQTAKDIESCVKTTDYTGKEIASRINQSATTVMIEAEHLALEGQILISHFGEDVTEKFSDIDSAIKNAKETADGAAKTIADLCIEEDITYIDGSKIYTGSVTAEQIDVESIFAQDVIATGTIRGAELVGGTVSGAKIEGYATNESMENAAKTATNFLEFDPNSEEGLLIGDKSTGEWSGTRAQVLAGSFNILDTEGTPLSQFGLVSIIGPEDGNNVYVDSDSVDIRSGETILATFAPDQIELGKNGEKTVISMCAGAATMTADELRRFFFSAEQFYLYVQHGSGGNISLNTGDETEFNGASLCLERDVENSRARAEMYADEIIIDGQLYGINLYGDVHGVNYLSHKGTDTISARDVARVVYDSGYYFIRPDNTDIDVVLGAGGYPLYKVFTERLEVTEARIQCLPSYQTTTSYSPNVYVGTSGLFSRYESSSSKTIKHDIRELSSEELKAERLYDINVVQFKYNDGIITDKTDARYGKDLPGFIIEDLVEKYPIAVDMPTKDVSKWSWNERYLMPAIVKLLQQQHKEILKLREKLDKIQIA